MFDTIKIRLRLNQRAVIFRDGLPSKALGPGVHRVKRDGSERLVFDTDTLVFAAPAAVRAVLPADWFREIDVSRRQIGLVIREGRPVELLEAGVHRLWTVEPGVGVEIIDLDADPPDDERVLDLLGDRVLRTIIGQHQRGLMYRRGRLERVLEPGRFVLWNTADAPTSVVTVDMRRQLLPVQGQELMTRDKVSLRLSLTVEWAPMDPALHRRVAADPKASLYTLAQLALRDFVAGVTLDELLEQRAELTVFLERRMVGEAEQMGVRVTRVGVKDVMLPGEMKGLLNRVIEAEKQSVADAIVRKTQAAETRAQANAAQLMAERPALMRLRELDAMTAIAGSIDELKVVMGAEGLHKALGRALTGG